MIELLLKGVVWFQAGLGFAVVAVVVRGRKRGAEVPRDLAVAGAVNLFFGCVITALATGHLVAVSIKAAEGTLSRDVDSLLLYPLGLALLIPAGWLVVTVWRHWAVPKVRTLVALNGWLGILLLVSSGARNPLALFAALNVAAVLISTRRVRWAIGALTGVIYVAMFVASVVTDGRGF